MSSLNCPFMKSISPVILPTVEEMGKAAADYGASILREMLLTKERVNLVVATGASQFTVLSQFNFPTRY